MIGSAIERGSLICVYDERGTTLYQKAKGSGPKDGLLGFTGSTVTVRFGSVIYTYGERGETIYANRRDRLHHPRRFIAPSLCLMECPKSDHVASA
jgi:hypothetical protein